MHVGNGSEVLRHETAVESVESLYAVIFPLEVCLHESHVGSHLFEERPGEGSAQNRYAQVWILSCQGADDGHEHGHVAERREAHYQEMLSFHFLLFLVEYGIR